MRKRELEERKAVRDDFWKTHRYDPLTDKFVLKDEDPITEGQEKAIFAVLFLFAVILGYVVLH